MQSMKNFGRTLWANLRNGRLSTTFGILAALSLGVLAGSMITGSVSAGGQHGVDSSDARPLMIPNPVTLSNGFSGIVKQVGPAVVNINTESLPKQSAVRKGRRNTPNGDNGSDQGDMQDFFNRFFGGQNPGGDGDGMPDGGERRALGSGFIVDPRGYIITNNHVVDKADRIYVKLSTDPESSTDNGRLATVVGVDKDTDIAVIKIDPKGLTLPTVKLGNSDGARSVSRRPSRPVSSAPRTAPSTNPAPTASPSPSFSASSRPMRPSIPATPAVRWSTCPAR